MQKARREKQALKIHTKIDQKQKIHVYRLFHPLTSLAPIIAHDLCEDCQKRTGKIKKLARAMRGQVNKEVI
jgi:hypothetical protein